MHLKETMKIVNSYKKSRNYFIDLLILFGFFFCLKESKNNNKKQFVNSEKRQKIYGKKHIVNKFYPSNIQHWFEKSVHWKKIFIKSPKTEKSHWEISSKIED